MSGILRSPKTILGWLLAYTALLCNSTALQARAQQPEPLIISTLGDGAIALDGPWQFHLGDNPAWAMPTVDDTTSKDGWEQLRTDQPWGTQGHYNYNGFAWYRRHITFSKATGTPPDLALLIQNVDDCYEIYWNGKPVGKFGKLPPRPILYFDQPAQTYGLGHAESGVLAVRVWMPAPMSSDPGEAGGFESVPEIGTPDGIAARKAMLDYKWMRAHQLSFGLDSLYVLIAVLCLLAWLRDRTQWMLFWMALFCFYAPSNLLILSLRFAWPANLAFGLMQPVYQLGDIPLWFLLLWLLDLRDNVALVKWVRVASITIFIASVLDGLVAVFGWTSPYVLTMQISDAIFSTIVLILAPVSLVIVGFAVLRPRRLNPIRWLIAIIVFVDEMITEFANAASQGIRFTHWSLSDTLQAQLFTINGSSVNAIQAGNVLMLFTLVYAVYRDLVENRRRQQTLEEEFKSAREVQQVLIPDTQPEIPGYRLTSSYKPAQEVGGDFFQIIPLENRETLVVLGDVSGKGLKAAMAVSLIVGMVRALAKLYPSPAALLTEINERLYGRLQGGFATCIALRLDSKGLCTVASAGHLSPFLNENELELPGAFPLGLVSAIAYEETTLQLSASDHLAVYTDGLLEARSDSGELYGFDRLNALFAAKPTAERATEAAVAFGQDDDITVLTLTRQAVS